MQNLAVNQCQNPASTIKAEQFADYLAQIPLWQISISKKSISLKYEFKNFKQTMFFVNAVAYICEQQGHHPDAKFGFNYCEISFTTHDIGGLSLNDFICAAKIDALLIK